MTTVEYLLTFAICVPVGALMVAAWIDVWNESRK